MNAASAFALRASADKSLAMTMGTASHSRGTKCPSDAWMQVPRKQEGAGNAGCWPHPQPCVQRVESTQASHHRYAETVRHSPRNGLRLIPRSPRRSGLDSLRRLREIISGRLDSSVGESGPRGFARPHRYRTPGDIAASIASRSNVCGDWPNAPPRWKRDARIQSYISVKRKKNIFSVKAGHVGQISA